MAKTNHGQELWSFPLYFEPILGQKYGFQMQHFPCEFSLELISIFLKSGAPGEWGQLQNHTF